jgi:hypothetical protein
MRERIETLMKQAGTDTSGKWMGVEHAEKFAELIINQCIDKIETYRIPVGNSSSGELACEWTYTALKEIRDDIKEIFGVKE